MDSRRGFVYLPGVFALLIARRGGLQIDVVSFYLCDWHDYCKFFSNQTFNIILYAEQRNKKSASDERRGNGDDEHLGRKGS